MECGVRYTKLELLELQACVYNSPGAWKGIISTIDPLVYQELCSLEKKLPGRRRNVDRRDRTRPSPPVNPSLSEELESLPDNLHLTAIAVDHVEEVLDTPQDFMEEDYEDSDDGGSLQPLAFYVEGEPDFASGPPQDGYEYLRRVMWEAAQCPKVKTAKVRANSEQTPYMPKIPPVPICSHELLPSKAWSKAFLEDFSRLRASFSFYSYEHSGFTDNLQRPLPPIRNMALWRSFCFANKAKVSEEVARNANFEESKDSFMEDEPHCNGVAAEIMAHPPFLGILLRLDEISRATLFRYHVAWLREQCTLSYERASWLFSLAAVVDFPLDDQTSASFRDLMRKCAELRMDKKPEDEELCMLNILITIAGDYFGQAEHSSS